MLTPDQLLKQGRYRIVKQFGFDGHGAGYEAFDKFLNTNVLLKEIHENFGKVTTPAQLESRKVAFANEAQALMKLKNESLLQIQDSFSEVDRHYLVAENAEGATLGELLEKQKTAFEISTVSSWVDQLLDGVNYLHQQLPPILHRDIKPSNIKLCPDGKIKLMIFNVAQSADSRAGAAQKNQSFDAAALPYSPLEQIWEGLDSASKKVILTSYDEESEKILESPVDARSDIYAVGATFYHLLTGRLPADALTRSIDLLEGKLDPLPTPFELNSSVPPEISDVVMTALEIRREHRYSSAAIMRQVLRTAFVRIRERQAQAGKKEEIKLENPVPTQKQAAKQPAKQENPTIEADEKRQLELIKQQLREAEARRLEAERRAAEAEKRLLEKEAKMLKVREMPLYQAGQTGALPPLSQVLNQPEQTPAPETSSAPPVPVVMSAPPVEMLAEAPPAATAAPEPAPLETESPVAERVKEVSPAVSRSDQFDNLFAQPEKEGGMVKKMSAAAGVLVVVGLAAWVVWTFVIAKPGRTDQSLSPTAAVATPAPTVNAVPDPAVNSETAASTDNAPATSTDAPANMPAADGTTTAGAPSTKAKPVAPVAPPVKKPNIATTKAPANEKKSVTLDDLLKDN